MKSPLDSSAPLPEAIPGNPAEKPSLAPAFTLLLLAPIIAEVLMGATRISVIYVLIPEIMVWGCGALMIREAVRRWRAGWASMILLGLALAVAEECVIQQTSLAPLVGAQHVYGRFFGVNWIYLLGLLVYECVWVVLVPVELTEMLFPARRHQPWLRKRGLAISGIVFLIGSYIAWYAWTQRARPMVFHLPKYQPPLLDIAIALAAILLLILAALRLRTVRLSEPGRASSAPRPWFVGLATFLLSLLCFLLIGLAYGAAPRLPFRIAMVGGFVWAAFSLMLIRGWASSAGWREMHRFALVFGALLASMSAGFITLAGGALPIDWIGKSVLNVIAVVLMIRLGQKLRLREALKS
ncbi:MAG: hypothetical protein P8Z30_03030 [Acidobacteriota bacterium]